jgi:hypothetical protein
MSVDPKKFGLSSSLLETVKEALKGNQHKLDKNHNGKLDAQDFKMLRKEDAKPDYLDFDKDGNKKEPMKSALKNKNMKEGSSDLNQMSGKKKPYSTGGQDPGGAAESVALGDRTNPKQGNSVNPKERSIGEATAVGAPVPNMAAAMDARKSEVQRKIAQKQASFQQAKAKQRISGSMKEAHKCSCGETKESKMTCEVHGKEKGLKGGKEPVEMNPPLREASDLPKKVVTKGHEIAKSLIKHKSKVDNPYAVGMATAKKSAGIKEDSEQIDELSKKTKMSYAMKADKQISRTDAGYGKRHGALGTKGVSTADFVRKYANRKAGIKQAMKTK